MVDRRLDYWLPDPSVRTHHRRASPVDPDELWRAALELRLSETRALGRLIRWRIPGTPAEQSFSGLFRSYPFTVLQEDRHSLISGLCGRIWTMQRDYPALAGPAAFRDWDEAGTVRVLFGHLVEPLAAGETEFVTEARVAPVDAGAARRLRALWTAVGPFQRLVGSEALKLVVKHAEQSAARGPDRRAPARRARNARR
jgi:hypothetical protein